MSDWLGGPSAGGGRPPNAKIPVKRHRGVCLIRTRDAMLAEELLARPRLGRLIVGRLTDDVLLVRHGAVADVVDELRKMGHTPRVEGGK